MKKVATTCAGGVLLAAAMMTGCEMAGTIVTPNDTATKIVAIATPRLFLMGQDYATKKAVLEKVSSDSVFSAGLKDWTSSDVILDAQGDSLYVLNRKTGAVTGFAHGDLSQPFVDVQLTGPKDDAFSGANPYAVARIGGRLWVACYGSPYLKAIDLASQKLVDSIDLSGWAFSGQASPNTVDVHAWNGKLAVTLGRLDGWDPGDSSLVLVLDPSTKAVEKRMALPWTNPYGISWSGDTLLAACVGKWTTADYSDILKDGGLAMVVLSSGTVKSVVSEQSANANITKAVMAPGGKAFVGFGHADYSTTLALVSLADGSVGSDVAGIKNVTDLAWSGTVLWVAEHDAKAPAVYRLDASGAVKGKVTTTLAPGSLAILP